MIPTHALKPDENILIRYQKTASGLAGLTLAGHLLRKCPLAAARRAALELQCRVCTGCSIAGQFQ